MHIERPGLIVLGVVLVAGLALLWRSNSPTLDRVDTPDDPAPAATSATGEIQERLKQTDLQPSVNGHFLSILDVSDLVKFSKYLPEATSAYGVITAARQIVQATIPVTDEEEATPPNPAAIVNNSYPENSLNGKYQPTEVSA